MTFCVLSCPLRCFWKGSTQSLKEKNFVVSKYSLNVRRQQKSRPDCTDICLAENSHEMSSLIFFEKITDCRMFSATNFLCTLKVKK